MMVAFLYFFIAAFLAFYVPGNVLLKRFKFDSLSNFLFSVLLGIVLWAYQGFIFGFLQVRQFSYIYLIVFLLIWIKMSVIDQRIKVPKISLDKKDFLLILLLVIGVGIQLSFTFLNGIAIKNGIYFCCGIPDSLYHIGLTNSLVNHFPPFEPAMSGVVVENYHYLSNLVEAELIRVFHLSLIFTQYQYMSLLVSILLGLSMIVISRLLKLGRTFSFFLLIFLFFWGDITYVLSLLVGKGLRFNTPFLYDSTNLWFSPPRAFGALINFVGIGLFIVWIKKNSVYLSVLLGVIFGSLVGFKIYNGFIVFVGLFFVSLYFLKIKDYKKLLLPVITLIISLAIYLPVNNQASGLSFVGLWRIENFIVQHGFGLGHLELARQIYLAHGNILRLIEYEAIYALAYFIFVFGSLNIAWFQSIRSLKMFPKELNFFLIPSIFISLIVGFFFFQKVSGSNTSQFIITAEIISVLYAALACTVITKRLGKFKFIFVALLILFTIPRVVDQTQANILTQVNKGGYLVDSKEMDGLSYLKHKTSPSSLILSDNQRLKIEKTCYYIGFLSDRSLFLCDANGILKDHGANVDKRSRDLEEIVKNFNSDKSTRLLLSNKIDYIYTSSAKGIPSNDSKVLKTVFLNDKIRIIKVKR